MRKKGVLRQKIVVQTGLGFQRLKVNIVTNLIMGASNPDRQNRQGKYDSNWCREREMSTVVLLFNNILFNAIRPAVILLHYRADGVDGPPEMERS